ncbi:hypothetical protein [Cupriavidus sp. SW-Y-13]|uniref:hypothetical protein n=1 Tax=Cupriavidus sp. SW-Y-13 TaxID=2653854 RepID=UPI0013651CFF|nr:hypothetical protein [Cupriavidus sp. SW-Y-13]MWL87173.1 hypothetical protein [Cupriavidus sp. SW-Y-13]
MRSMLSKLFARPSSQADSAEARPQPLDYEKMVTLDAEELAEQGIVAAYQRLLPQLKNHVARPALISEEVEANEPSYKVQFQGNEFLIYSGSDRDAEAESWGRATYYFFLIVNSQLNGSDVRFYAINSGNDLGGIFLTPAQAESAQRSIERRTDWPYIPSLDGPWYGQYH